MRKARFSVGVLAGCFTLIFGLSGRSAMSAAGGISTLPPEAQAGISAALGRDLPAYCVMGEAADLSRRSALAGTGGLEARNPTNKLAVDFTAQGVVVQSGTARWKMALGSYGYGTDLKTVEATAPTATANRVEYRRRGLTEWYVNGPMGLEQGFTISRRSESPGRPYRPLTVALALSGDLTPQMDPSGKDLTLTAGNGEPVLRYAGLTARDADGKDLQASLEVQGSELLLRVDDSKARYPVVIDPWVQLAELSASNGVEGAEFGFTAAISGNTVVVGAYSATVGSNSAQGAAYVFVKPSTGWANMTQLAVLTASDGEAYDIFGRSVGISGNTVVVGAPQAAIGSNYGQGAAYVFVKPPTGWATMTQTAKLTASDGASEDQLGSSVAMSGSTAVAGAPFAPAGDTSGRAYVFIMPAGGWVNTTQTAELSASEGQYGDILGSSVAISGHTVVAGAPGWNSGELGQGQGAAYLFQEPRTGWANMTETAELIASDGVRGDQLGWSVAVSENTVIAGAPYATVAFNEYQGAAYVFVRPADGWADEYQNAKLTIADGQPGDQLGISVAASNDGRTLVAGAPGATIGANQDQGAAYVFVRPANGWENMTQTAELFDSQGTADEGFSYSVAGVGNVVLAGAPGATVNGTEFEGAAFVFGP